MSELHEAVTVPNGPIVLNFSCNDLSCIYLYFSSSQGHGFTTTTEIETNAQKIIATKISCHFVHWELSQSPPPHQLRTLMFPL